LCQVQKVVFAYSTRHCKKFHYTLCICCIVFVIYNLCCRDYEHNYCLLQLWCAVFGQYQFLGDRVLEFGISSYVVVFWKTQYPSKQNQRGILSLLGCWDSSGIYFSVNLWGRIIKWPADKEDFLGEPPQCGWGCNHADDDTD
jgi:hypothetical protein